ncbi:hypothetical protein GUJ93_ZPchr0012g19136 [Zizania palustris]|uniref:Uncharacterized protein n=1 Tax=Zizania palustris TaxID=103762 RepID=A0A8J6BTK8_ZIZPA|nr:hypothetical protein GUJ93_ZPchr0012g19136 [Zizania palustris]
MLSTLPATPRRATSPPPHLLAAAGALCGFLAVFPCSGERTRRLPALARCGRDGLLLARTAGLPAARRFRGATRPSSFRRLPSSRFRIELKLSPTLGLIRRCC